VMVLTGIRHFLHWVVSEESKRSNFYPTRKNDSCGMGILPVLAICLQEVYFLGGERKKK
jgi:hypothetical protein